jgi:DNA-directed RNA polymerase III subunit RPC1
LLKERYETCGNYIKQYDEGKLELTAGCNLEESLESYLNGELGKLREEVGKELTKTLPKHNAALIMA